MLILPFQNCSPLHSVDGGQGTFNSEGGGTSFAELKDTIFAPKCLACHGAGNSTNFTSHADLMAGASVQPGSPATSPLYIRVENHSMPMGGTPLSPGEISAIYDWIAAGALEGGPAPAPTTVPSAPSMLVADALSSNQVELSWADNSNNESGFLIERATVAAGPFTALITVGSNVTLHNDLGAQASTTYYYRVSAVNVVGSSAPSALATIMTPAPPVTIPSPPSNLAATVNSSTQITLNWNDNSGNETGFKVERSVGGGAYVQVSMTMANVSSYVDTGLSPVTAYTYRVRATNSAGDSAFTADVVATTQAPPVVIPAAPSNLTATVLSSTQITLNFVDNSNNETGFKIERSVGGGAYAQITMNAANTTSYIDTGLLPSTAYSYRVRSTNSAGDSAYTPVVTATTQAPPVTPPVAPSALAAVANSSTQVTLTWVDNSNNETGFKVERSSGGGAFTQIFVSAAGATSYVNTGLTAATAYTYRVRATNSAGDSAYSANAVVTTPAAPMLPAAPSGLAAVANSSTQITLSWTDNSNNETGFKIERSSGGGAFTQIFVSAAGATSYVNTGLTAATAYTYRVRATGVDGDSAYTPNAVATTLAAIPAAPSNLVATVNSSTQITLTWADNSANETGFKLERSVAGGAYTQIFLSGANVATYVDMGLTASTAYSYRVRSTNAGGDSAYSPVATGTTPAAGVNNATYAYISANILVPRCTGCHGASGGSGGVNLATYAGVFRRVSPGNANASILYTEVNSGNMPEGGSKLPAAQITLIREWINAGALNN